MIKLTAPLLVAAIAILQSTSTSALRTLSSSVTDNIITQEEEEPSIQSIIGTSADNTILKLKQNGSLQYVDNFLSPEELISFNDDMDILQQNLYYPTATFLGHVLVNELIQQRIKNVAGSEFSIDDSIIANDDGSIMMQTRIINGSTTPHIDYRDDKAVEDDVMFITLNSNPKAHFTHDGNSLPVVAGRLLRFSGSALHGTTHNGGDPIRLLGPFSIKNFASVGTRALLEVTPGATCATNGLCIEGGPSTGTITSSNVPVSGVGECNPNAECYELLGGMGAGNCPSATGVCVDPMDNTFSSFGNGTPCEDSCYVCSTCPPPTTSTMATTTSAATTTQATTTTTPMGDDLFTILIGLGLPPIVALIIVIFSTCFNVQIDSMELEEVMEALNDKGGIRGRRILEDKENLKALLTSLLKEKLDDGINIKLEGVITEAMESLGVDIRGHRILESKEDLKALLVSLQEKLNEY